MKRQLLAALLTGLLVLAPSAAFAQEGEDGPSAEETIQNLEDAVQLLQQNLDDARTERDAVTEDDAASDDEVDEAQSVFDELLSQLRDAFSTLMATVMFAEQADDGGDTDADDDEADEGADGEAVSTLAHCAPRGSFKAMFELMGTHGEYVTAAAHGETVTLNLPTIDVTGDEPVIDGEAEPVAVDYDLSNVEGAEALCDTLDVLYQAQLLDLDLQWDEIDDLKGKRALIRQQCQIQRLRERNGADVDANQYCADLREKVKDLHAERRAEAKAEREAARAEAKEAREAAKAERAAARAEAKAARGRS